MERNALPPSVEPPVESNVPLTPRPLHSKYPWPLMEIGDSFLVPGVTISHIASLAHRAAKRLNVKFTCRTMKNGIRVWRIA